LDLASNDLLDLDEDNRTIKGFKNIFYNDKDE
jgi:hypothetical protein